eukprot:1116305-Amphidinium_carterae.1
MMIVLPKSPNEELEKEKRVAATEFYNKEPCIKEAGQEHPALVKFVRDMRTDQEIEDDVSMTDPN